MALVLITVIELFFFQGSVIRSLLSPVEVSVLIGMSQTIKSVVMTSTEIAEPTIKLAANMEVFLCVVFVDEDNTILNSDASV